MATEPKKLVGWSFVAITGTRNLELNFNRVTFINQGTTTVKIGDAFTLLPQASITLPCWPGEISKSVFNITFSSINGSLLIAVVKTDV